MTVEKYLETNNMTQTEFSKISGIPIVAINRHLKQNKKFHPKYFKSLENLGIEFEVKGDKELTGFDYFRNGVRYSLAWDRQGTFFCYTEEQVNHVTTKLNEKKIAYYSYFKDCYWVINWDKRAEWEGTIC